MTWTKTGTDTYWNKTSSQGSATVTAGTTGDLRVILFLSCASTVSVSSLSGGGVTTWARAGSVEAVSVNSIGIAANAEIWYGKITGSGTALTVTYAGTLGSTSCRGMQRDFRTNRSGTPTYSVAGYAYTQTNNHTSSSPLAWPSLTTKGSDELVVGCMGNYGTGSAYSGSTTGYTYTTDGDANYHLYRLSCAAAEVEAPTVTFTGTDGWYAHQAIFDDGLSAPGAAAVTAAGKQAGATAIQNVGSASVTASAKQAGSNVTQNVGSASATAAGKGATATATQNAGSASVTAAAKPITPTVVQNAGTASVAATAFGAAAIMGVAPSAHGRIFTVPAEDRSVLAETDVRTYTVDPEDRVLTVSVDDEENGA